MSKQELEKIIEQQEKKIRELESKQNQLLGYLQVTKDINKECETLTSVPKMINAINKLMNLGLEV